MLNCCWYLCVNQFVGLAFPDFVEGLLTSNKTAWLMSAGRSHQLKSTHPRRWPIAALLRPTGVARISSTVIISCSSFPKVLVGNIIIFPVFRRQERYRTIIMLGLQDSKQLDLFLLESSCLKIIV